MNPTVAVLRTAFNTTSLLAPNLAGRGVFALFRRGPRRSQVRPAEQASIDAAQRGTLSVAGKSIVTYLWGDGSNPVLLVHGWGSRASRYATFVPLLRERGYSVVSFDAPAHGDSSGDATHLLEFRDAIKQLQKQHGGFAAIIGHSFGSLAAFLAVREGVQAGALVGIASVSQFEHLVTGFCEHLGLRERLRQELHKRVETDLFPNEPDIWDRFASPWSPEQVAAPRILVVHDEDDDLAAVAQGHEIADAYQGRAESLFTKGLGHRRIMVDPAVVARVVAFVDAPEAATAVSPGSGGPETGGVA